VESQLPLQRLAASAETFRLGLSAALGQHTHDKHADFPALGETLVQLRAATKPCLTALRAAYAQVFATTIARATYFLSLVQQRKLPSAIPPLGRTIRVAQLTGAIQGIYQRLGPQASSVWTAVKPLVINDLELLRHHANLLASTLEETGQQFASM
jgi:hypothetical protein